MSQALHLCQFFESESLDLSGTRIIELGGGTGLVGIVAARLGKALIYVCAIEILKIHLNMNIRRAENLSLNQTFTAVRKSVMLSLTDKQFSYVF